MLGIGALMGTGQLTGQGCRRSTFNIRIDLRAQGL